MQIEQAYAHYLARTPLEGFSNEEILHVRRFFSKCAGPSIQESVDLAKLALTYKAPAISNYNIQIYTEFCKHAKRLGYRITLSREEFRDFRNLRGKLECRIMNGLTI